MNPFDLGHKAGHILDIYIKGGHKFEYVKIITDADGYLSGTYDGERLILEMSEIVAIRG